MSPPDEEFTHREIKRLIDSVDRLEVTISGFNTLLTETVDRLEDRIAERYVTKETFRQTREYDQQAALTLTEKVQRTTSVIDWAGKLIVGAVILALLGIVLYNGGEVP